MGYYRLERDSDISAIGGRINPTFCASERNPQCLMESAKMPAQRDFKQAVSATELLRSVSDSLLSAGESLRVRP
jgi:hypothetical protein